MSLLTVKQASPKDVYRDIVRIPEQYRVGPRGETIPEGCVCRIVLLKTGKSGYAIVRGTRGIRDGEKPIIMVDERLRNILGVNTGDQVELMLRKVGLFGEFRWAWNASDPAYRAAARMALLSVVLGVAGLLLGILSIVR